MGTFTVEIEVGDPEGRRFEPLQALVDTGATNTAIPTSVLQRLGVKPYRASAFRLADGSRAELGVGRTWVRVDGQLEFTQVVFIGDGTPPLLGAVTLEELGLAVDPIQQKLVPVDKLMLQALRAGPPWRPAPT